jgi:subtilase family serine protease
LLAEVSLAAAVQPQKRIVGPIDESHVITLHGNVHPMARGEFDRGAVSGSTRLERLVLELEPSAGQQAELDGLVEAQHDPGSPLYQHWLTPEEYGARFGVSAGDLQKVVGWLQGHGFAIEEIPAGNRLVVFSGSAGQLEAAFHPAMHVYEVDGVEHVANALDPQIPAALAGVVGGVVSLHDFRRKGQSTVRRALKEATPEYTSGGANYLFPADWATIYDLNSLYAAGVTGKGTTIAIVGRSNIVLSDVAMFRSASGLAANQPTVVLVNSNPGLVSGDQDEATLDVEWSGATAPGAAVEFVTAASTATTDGVDLSAQYIVNHNVATVMSTSYGSCEQDMGTVELMFYNALWQQAAAQGISAIVSSGDAGVAGCYGGSSTTASGTGVNGLCSSQYSTCVGGTEFNEGSSNAKYWASTNAAGTEESALGYIPEKVWNESALDGGSGLWASGGGASVVYAQPTWQKGLSGVAAANGMRAVPDIAMSAAGHDGYIIVEHGSFYVIAGTSAASPSFAGLMALLVQSRSGKGQGNANTGLYALAGKPTGPFHSTPSGNNSVPGVTGFTASGGTYNLATGLGSVDGALLVSQWGSPLTTTSVDFSLSESASSGAAQTGGTAKFTVSVTESGSGKSVVALTAKSASGVTVAISPASITPGTTATVSVSVGSTAPTCAQTITVTGTDATGTQTVNYALTVSAPPTLTLSAATSAVTVALGASAPVSFAVGTGGSFTGNVSLSLGGLPSGVTASWSANPVSAALGSASATLTLAAGASTTVGSSTLTVTAAGDGLTATTKVTLQVAQTPSFTLAISPAAVSMQSLGMATLTVTATPVGGAVVASGAAGSSISVASVLPKGVTASWSSASVNTAGAVVWTLTLTGSSMAAAGTETLGLSAKIAPKSGSIVSASANLPLTVSLTPATLSLATASSAVSVVQGKTATDAITLTANGTFSGAVTLNVNGLPSGVLASWSTNGTTLSNGGGASTLTLTATPTATAGSTLVTVTATGDGVTATKTVTVQVQQAPGLTMGLSATTLSMTHTSTGQITVSVTPVGGLKLTGVNLAVSGLPVGVTAKFGQGSVSSAGLFTASMTLTGSSSAKTGNFSVNVAASTGSNGSPDSATAYTASQTFILTLK